MCSGTIYLCSTREERLPSVAILASKVFHMLKRIVSPENEWRSFGIGAVSRDNFPEGVDRITWTKHQMKESRHDLWSNKLTERAKIDAGVTIHDQSWISVIWPS